MIKIHRIQMKRPPLLAFCLLIAVVLPANAQRHSVTGQATTLSAYKLVAVKVEGTSRYTDQEVIAASGLQIGQNAADGDFKEAVQRLGDTGAFEQVAYSFSASGTNVKLEFQLADAEPSKLVPAHFENFVWFTDDELLTAIHNRVPLFKQVLPIGGNLPDRVSEALQAILSDKHLPGRVSFLRSADEQNGPLDAIDYRVEEVSVRIRNVEFPGASPEHADLLTTAARHVIGAEYDRIRLAKAAKFDLLPVYQQRGYLKAAFGRSDARLVPQSAPQPAPTTDAQGQGPAEIEVDAIVPVTPGKMYSTSSVDWHGNSAITTAELAPLIHLPPSQPADAVRLAHDLESVTKLYRRRGYMTIQAKSDSQFDEEKSMVHYDLNVAEGDQYKMGELEITGLDTQARGRLIAAWTLHEGQPYNADYPHKFLDDTGNLLPPGVRWDITLHETLEKDKTVDVELHFK
jgi:outer membrane protein assembly factor BamA